MPGGLTSWLRRARHQPAGDAGAGVLNSATHVTTAELIGLQQPARKLKLARRLPATASITGNHRSRFRGRGMDYAESRIYQPGDDIRGMDWRVTARAGRPHVKVYEEERERPVALLLDFGPSLFFGSRKALKSVVAARIATLLAWAAARNGDRVGALLFNGDHSELPPRRGQRGVLTLIRNIVTYADPLRGLAARPEPGHLTTALERLRRTVRPGSLIFLIGDFYDIDDDTGHQLQRLRQHNDVVAIQIVDPLERQAPPPGLYAVTDGQRTGFLDTRDAGVRRQYDAFFEQHHHRIAESMRQHQIPLLRIDTGDDEVKALQSWFGSNRRKPQPTDSEAA